MTDFQPCHMQEELVLPRLLFLTVPWVHPCWSLAPAAAWSPGSWTECKGLAPLYSLRGTPRCLRWPVGFGSHFSGTRHPNTSPAPSSWGAQGVSPSRLPLGACGEQLALSFCESTCFLWVLFCSLIAPFSGEEL